MNKACVFFKLSDLIMHYPRNYKKYPDIKRIKNFVYDESIGNYGKADLYIKEKKYDEALQIIEKVIEENENYLEAYNLGSKASLQKGDLAGAKEYAQNAISLDINCASGYYYLSLVRALEGDYEEAIECMKRAIFHDINNPEYYASMSRLYKEKGDVKSAFEYIKEAQSLNQTSEEYKTTYKELASLNRK